MHVLRASRNKLARAGIERQGINRISTTNECKIMHSTHL
jgi:hypothetical protein